MMRTSPIVRTGCRVPANWCTGILLLLGGVVLTGCRTPEFPVIDLGGQGWEVRQAQAIWQREAEAPELVVDLIVAEEADGRVYLQVSKDVFPLVNVLLDGERWWIESPPEDRRFGGRGRVPVQSVWPQLAGVIAGHGTGRGWTWEGDLVESGNLRHLRRGESAEVVFFP